MIINALNNKSAWKFLALLSYSPGAGYTRKQILELLKWNNISLDKTIRKLQFYKIIVKDKRVIRLNFESEEAKKLLEIIAYEKKKMNFPPFELFVVLTEFLRMIENKDIIEVYLFGSQAKKTASIGSDIDIAIISEKKINLVEQKDRIMQNFGQNIQLHYFSTIEKGKLIDEVKKDGVRLV